MFKIKLLLFKWSRKLKQFNYWLWAQAVFMALALLRLLPAKSAIRFSAWFARKVGPLTPRHKVATNNLRLAYPEKSDAEITAMMGTTPMIGYNDVQGEVFYMSDANLVMQDATERGLGMIGIWSMMRDQPGVPKQVSPEHSGLSEQQAPKYAFSEVFAPFTKAGNEVSDGVISFEPFNDTNEKNVWLTLTQEAFKARKFVAYHNGKYMGHSENSVSYYSQHWASNNGLNEVIKLHYYYKPQVGDKIKLVEDINGNEKELKTIILTQDMLK